MSSSSSEESGSESDIEMQSALPDLSKKKTSKKTPKSPSDGLLQKPQDPKKMTTKDMIKEALTEQKSRKGISLHAIRKYIVERHTVNVDRINTLLKKSLKSGIEDGTFVQTKGIGASGSFRLAPKKKPDPSDKPKKKKPKAAEPKEKSKKTKKEVDKKEIVEKKGIKKKAEVKNKTDKPEKKEKSQNKEKLQKKEVKDKEVKSKMAKIMKTPAKKRAAMMKRKSIGSIIKPPKMKPKAK